jgi:transcriptional regulator GlxA family with amidase domain
MEPFHAPLHVKPCRLREQPRIQVANCKLRTSNEPPGCALLCESVNYPHLNRMFRRHAGVYGYSFFVLFVLRMT